MSSSSRSGQVDFRTARQLRELDPAQWRVSIVGDRHHVQGPSGAYAVRTDAPAHIAEVGVQLVVVLWSDFPQEVVEIGGIYLVHGDSLADFLLAQPHLMELHSHERYEIA